MFEEGTRYAVCLPHRLLQVHKKRILHVRQASFDHTLVSLGKVPTPTSMSFQGQLNIRWGISQQQKNWSRANGRCITAVYRAAKDVATHPDSRSCRAGGAEQFRIGEDARRLEDASFDRLVHLEEAVSTCLRGCLLAPYAFSKTIRRCKVCHNIATMRILFCRSTSSSGLAVGSSLPARDLRDCDQADRL